MGSRRNIVYVYIGHLLKFISPVVLVPYYARVLKPSGFGELQAALSLMAIISVISNGGLQYSSLRDLAKVNELHQKYKIVSSQIAARLLIVPVCIGVGAVCTYYSPILSNNMELGVLATALGTIYGFGCSWFFQGTNEYKMALFTESVVYPVNIFLALLTVKGSGDVVFALYSLLAARLVGLAVSYICVLRRVRLVFVKISDVVLAIRRAFAMFSSQISFAIVTVGSTYFLSRVSTSTLVGYYSSAEKLTTLLICLLHPFGLIMLPAVSRVIGKSRHDAYSMMKKGVAVELLYGVLVMGGVFFFSGDIVNLLFGGDFEPTTDLLKVLIWSLPFAALKHSVTLYVLIPINKDKYSLFVDLFLVLIFLLLVVFIVPGYGAVGMVWSRLISVGLSCVLLMGVLVYIRKDIKGMSR